MTVLDQVRKRIADRGISEAMAAREIGVSPQSLRRHLEGEYSRSDSLAKYRLWLSPPAPEPGLRQVRDDQRPTVKTYGPATLCSPEPPPGGWRVVDLFSGCGGLSLGFELVDAESFNLVLAADLEPSALDVLNRNRPLGKDPARTVDLSEFSTQAEIVAFYLDHVATLERDEDLRRSLDAAPIGLGAFLHEIAAVDARYLAELGTVRGSPAWRSELRGIEPVVLRQTSVLGFHDGLALPRPTSKAPRLGPLPWTTQEPRLRATVGRAASPGYTALAEHEWDSAVERLHVQSGATGARGQLASSAKRIAAFLNLLDGGSYEKQRHAWVRWRSKRNELCDITFSAEAASALSELYEDFRVSVLLGGPPCQGFSRIGRGKIRSLSEHSVHVHVDEEAGDSRNKLLEAYVQWVGALAPDVFLFENVRHFQASVTTPQGTFQATELLAEAIESLSNDHLKYSAWSRVIDASKHGVPQARERFFMAGVRDAQTTVDDLDLARWTTELSHVQTVPLRLALDGLGDAVQGAKDQMAEWVPAARPAGSGKAAGRYAAWVSATPPEWAQGSWSRTDAHVARKPRADDAALFSKLGPGMRWMDYRSDGTQTPRRLEVALTQLRDAVKRGVDDDLVSTVNLSEVEQLLETIDGSLPLRLMLESIRPQAGEEGHHFLTPTYLSKREGNHGDWLSRMDPSRPSKTIVSHMSKDTYAYVHPWESRTLSAREAARVQTFPDWFSFGSSSLVNAFRMIGNAVPPLLAAELAQRVAQVLTHQAAGEVVSSSEAAAAGATDGR